MKLFKQAIAIVFAVVFIAFSTSTAFAIDTGKEITQECRANLKMLNEATEKYLKETGKNIPRWSDYDNAKTMYLGTQYLPKPPVPPTKDCKYFLVALSSDNFQWYCDLHGVLDGDKTITFKYHEHRLMAKTNSSFKVVEKYELHTRELLRWTQYSPTLKEKLMYQYNKNPITTCIGIFMGLMVVLFLYKNLFH